MVDEIERVQGSTSASNETTMEIEPHPSMSHSSKPYQETYSKLHNWVKERTSGLENKEIWQNIITKLALDASWYVDRDGVEKKNLGKYFKVKHIATGLPKDSEIIKGLVFTNHAEDKKMIKYDDPSFLIVRGNLETSVCSSLLSSCLTPQDMLNLANLKQVLAESQDPQPRISVILLEGVAGEGVTEMLKEMDKDICIIDNMTTKRIKRIQHCFKSPDDQFDQNLLTCETIEFVDQSMVFLNKPPAHLACTVLLKGEKSELDYVKSIVKEAIVTACQFITEANSKGELYHVSLPPKKLLFDNLQGKNIEREIDKVGVKGDLLFEELITYVENFKEGFDKEAVVNMLKAEKEDFQGKIQNIIRKITIPRQILHLNRLSYELLIRALHWDKRLRSSPSAWLGHGDLNQGSTDGWLAKGYCFDGFFNDDVSPPLELPKCHGVIYEEGSRIHIPLPDIKYQYLVSDFYEDFSSLVACALTLLEYYSPHTLDIPYATLKQMGMLAMEKFPGGLDDTQSHPHISLWDEKSHKGKCSIRVFFANHFRTLRKVFYKTEDEYIASLSKCKRWDAQGGKSGSFFSKTLDESLIIKELQRVEMDCFLEHGTEYFNHMSRQPNTCLAKILGIYEVSIKPKDGKETNSFLMVMENLSFGRKISRFYDIKGVVNSARIAQRKDEGKVEVQVLLDQNFVADMETDPLCIDHESNEILQKAIETDTAFLRDMNVMDYSLLVCVDKERKELVCGIIDYLRQYTFDKQLEHIVKASQNVNVMIPTVIPPESYRTRMKKFMQGAFRAFSWGEGY